MHIVRVRRVVAAAVFSVACALGASVPGKAGVSGTDRLEGTLTVVWGDPGNGATQGHTRFTLTLRDGTAYRLHVPAAQRNTAVRNFGKPVVVQGRKITETNGQRSFEVTRLTAGVQGMLPALAPATGLKRTLFILL